MDHSIITLIKETSAILKEYSQQQQAWIGENYRGNQIYCKPHCSFCCNVSMKISLPEALLIFHSIEEETLNSLVSVAPKIRELWKNSPDEESFFESYRFEIGNCLFLSSNGSCNIYSHRPIPCRQTLSALPGEFCSRDIELRFTRKEVETALNSLNREIFKTGPYITPLLDLGEIWEYELKVASKRLLGYSSEGVMPVFMELLKGCKIENPDFSASQLVEHLLSVQEDPFLFKQV